MLPCMAGKPRIAIVGAGNFGSALAVALRRAEYVIEAVLGRARGESLRGESSKRAQKLAKLVGARVSDDLSKVRAEVIWFCVPDAEVARAARSLAEGIEWKGRVALHSSGALTSDELAGFARARSSGCVGASANDVCAGLAAFACGSIVRGGR